VMGLMALACFAATSLAQYSRSRYEVTLFADPEFSGRSLSLIDDVPDLRRYKFNDRVSSIRIPPGETWEICQDVNYGNRCMTLTRSEPDLSRIGWSDRISSLRRMRRSGSGGYSDRRFEPEGPGITVFTEPDYGGEGATFREDVPDLQAYELSDRISSVRIPRGEVWEVCQDINYGNRCRVISESEPDLGRIGWRRRISSLRRVRADSPTASGGRGTSRPGGPGITVFADRDFRGESATFDEDVPDLRPYRLSDRISSLSIPRGETWEVCQDINYGNRCEVFTSSEPNLERVGWNDRISSLRRAPGDRSRSR
jgi:hypothetical protein